MTKMKYKKARLPISQSFENDEDYISSLLQITSRPFFKKLVGSIHILEFFTGNTSPYQELIDEKWRTLFDQLDMDDILELILRHPLEDCLKFKKHCLPPSLAEFIQSTRRHGLIRTVPEDEKGNVNGDKASKKLKKSVIIGMSEKKAHEVQHFSDYVTKLLREVKTSHTGDEPGYEITHLVDFGAGVSYLSRALACPPHNLDVIAIESKLSNIEAGRQLDIRAKLTSPQSPDGARDEVTSSNKEKSTSSKGSIHYVQKVLSDGDMSDVIQSLQARKDCMSCAGFAQDTKEEANLDEIESKSTNPEIVPTGGNVNDPKLMIISLHSCGNLVHYALRALLQNDAVKAVAVVGCCYNLMTEKLGPSYKPPYQREELDHPAMNEDVINGFPLSNRFINAEVTLNITARMMACQAPANWTTETSSSFFTRHFYRALLQRILRDKGIVVDDSSLIIIGSLRKNCYETFYDYVTGAVNKILRNENMDEDIKIKIKMVKLDAITKEEVQEYEERFAQGRKEISIMWTLMAFCAGLVESLIVVDRYLFLKESDAVGEVKIEAAFDYGISPRNMVVVGIK